MEKPIDELYNESNYFFRGSMTLKHEIALCYYPTTVAVVDDNATFLKALRLRLQKKFDCNTFTDPQEALEYANQNIELSNLQRVDADKCSDTGHFVRQALSLGSNKRQDKTKNRELSVIIVDYNMPMMDGIEFCKSVKNPNIKKILLTGHAGDIDAIQAFNDKTIHYFINKNEPNLERVLQEAISVLQQEYFKEISSQVKARAIDGMKSLFSDKALANYFETICKDARIAEYYYMINPSRFILVNEQNEQSVLLIYTEEELDEHVQIMVDEEAPEEFIERVRSRKFIPYFQTDDGYYDPEKYSLFVDAKQIQGITNYYCGFSVEIQSDESVRLQFNTVVH